MDTKGKVIKAILDEVYPVSDKSLRLITEMLTYSSIPQNEVFIQCDRSNSSEYFILEGICRSYLLNPDGDDITISFFEAQSVLSPHITRTKNGRSLLNFQAITELTLASFNEQDFLNLMIDNLEVRFFANTVLRNELIRKVDKEIGLASLTAKERLLQFRARYDGLENKVPHPMIASYLGITNISLSRLRRALAEH
jgi:CRP-like cAMP-binding protein